MATTFPLSTYPLSDRTRISEDHTVLRDLLDDGTMRVRVVGSSSFAVLSLVWEYLDGSTCDALLSYIKTNRVTEFDITVAYSSPVVTYTGYFWDDPQVTPSQGKLYTVTATFRGSSA